MAEATPGPYYFHDRAIWSPSDPSDPDEVELMADRLRALPAEQQAEFLARVRLIMAAGVWPSVGQGAEILEAVQNDGVEAPRLQPFRRAREGQVVYYLLFADRVKIGTTGNLAARIASIPHDEVLATELGGYDLEKRRHVQFKALHIKGEWFRYEGALAEHIERLCAKAA